MSNCVSHADGVRPSSVWFNESLKYCTVIPFARDVIPLSLNGHNVTTFAHISDFYRFEVWTSSTC
jgi:hypothetical protein